MITGSVIIHKPGPVVLEKLRGFLGAANCDVDQWSDHQVSFRHGTYLTQTATLFPKCCRLYLDESDGTTTVRYEVRVALPCAIFLTLWGILFCWTLIMPIVAYRSLVYHPRRFIENLLGGA